MRIAWVTPVHPRSAIGRFSRLVRAALLRVGHDVTLVRCEAPELLAEADPEEPAECVRWTALGETISAREEFDIFVHNVGDSFPFHAGAVELLARFPGPIIFHDAYVLNLFLAWHRHAGRESAADALLNQIHGPGAAARVADALTRADFLAATESFSMIAWLARQADGAVAHARFYEPSLRAACAGPVRVIPLAYASLGEFPPLSATGGAAGFRILTFGHVNSNRRIESVLRAIGASPTLRAVSEYRVVGPIEEDERRRLAAIALEAGVTAVEFVGWVSDELLQAELAAADVICALRWPALEGASASVIEAMLSGRPVVVTDTGFYSDLPNDLVFKVGPDQELADLRAHLERLVQDRSIGARTGEAAAAWASTAFSADAYVDQLGPFLEEVIECQPLLRATERVGQNLARMGLRGDDPVLGRVATAMEHLFLSATGPPKSA